MITGLLVYLEAAVAKRGWSMAELARRAGISRQTFTQWRKNPNIKPDNSTIFGLAEALEDDVGNLLAALGVEMRERDGQADMGRLNIILESVPEAPQILDALAGADEAKRRSLVRLILWQLEK